jgi:molybdopterin synthase sulfur carrier subunit
MTRILFFGRLQDLAGRTAYELDIPQNITTISDLRGWIAAEDDQLREALQARDVRVVVDHVIRHDEAESVRGAGEVAFLPPVSGG